MYVTSRILSSRLSHLVLSSFSLISDSFNRLVCFLLGLAFCFHSAFAFSQGMDVQDFGGSYHSNWCSSSTAYSVCAGTGNLYWLVYENGLCGNGAVQYTCQVRNTNPCPVGLTWNQQLQNCVDPDACPSGQVRIQGVCVDVQDCGNGTILIDSTDPADCVGTDGTECPAGEYFYSLTEECLTPDSSSSSSSSSSSASSESSTSDSSSSDAGGSQSSDSSSGDGGSSGDGSSSGDGGSSGSSESGEANASGSCDEEPGCVGDAILCAQLKQTWLINCGKSVTIDEQCESDLVCEGDAVVCMGIRMDAEQRCAWKKERVLSDLQDFAQINGMNIPLENNFEVSNEDVNLQDVVGPFMNDETPIPTSCIPDETLSLSFGNIPFSYQTFCDATDAIRPWVILFASFMGAIFFFQIGFRG